MIDERLIATSTGPQMLVRVAALDEKARRAHAGPVKALFHRWYSLQFGPDEPKLKDVDALKVAMLAMATRAELRPYRFVVVPHSMPLVDVIRALAPSWIDEWVEGLVEDLPGVAARLAPLWRAGLCRRPQGDSRILGYYDHCDGLKMADHPEFLEEDVWRFFEVEGGGDLSLAGHDKYCKRESWTARLVRLVQAGELDRGRLLDSSLDALERDFGQFRAGWYSRFHAALVPSPEEQAARCGRYLRLLESAVPPTVSLALKALKIVDKAGRLPVDDLLLSIQPALLARQKSAVLEALQLLASAAKRAPARAPEIAVTALTSLVSDSPEVQEKALDLVERLGQAGLPEAQAMLCEHREIAAPSARTRLSRLLADPGPEPAHEQQREPVPQSAAGFEPLAPCASVEEALAAYLTVLEDPRDPLAVERAVDGVSRFGPESRPGSTQLSPVAKRAGQILARSADGDIKLALAALGLGWCGDGRPSDLLPNALGALGFGGRWDQCLAATFLERCDEIVDRIGLGHGLPLLSLPSDGDGEVQPHDLVDRLKLYRSAGAAPGQVDLALALTRLGRHGRDRCRERVDCADEAGRAVAFALGSGDAAGGDCPVWAAAWLARSDRDAEVSWPSQPAEPDAGIKAGYRLIVMKNASYGHPEIGALAVPELRRADRRRPGSLLHHRAKSWFESTPTGYDAACIAWSSLVRPRDPEAFLANAVAALEPWQKLADHPCIAYLEAFDRLSAEPGPMGYAVLAYYLASEDKALCAHTVDKLSRLVDCRRICAERFASAILPFMLLGPFPSMRWTRHLAALAETSRRHRAFVRDVLAGLMRFDSAQAPRDIGGVIELLYQLQLDSGEPFTDAPAIAFLERLGGSGKAAKASKQLLSLRAASPAPMPKVA